MLTYFLNVNMQAIWGGINAIQIISHLPLGNINFPLNTQRFYSFLVRIVSFDIYSPTDYIDFGFTETAPFHSNFEWLGYETSNFYECIGSVLLIGAVLILYKFLKVLAYKIAKKFMCCNCFKKRRSFSLLQPVMSNLWLRYFFETFFEFSISSLVGLTLYSKIKSEPNSKDKIAKLSATFFLTITIGFTILVIFIAIVAGFKLSK